MIPLLDSAPSRRRLLKAALASAASLALPADLLAQRSAQPFEQWVVAFRAKATGRGISGATYDRVMSGLTGIPLRDIIREIWAFIAILIAALVLMILVPDVVLWLPRQFGYLG